MLRAVHDFFATETVPNFQCTNGCLSLEQLRKWDMSDSATVSGEPIFSNRVGPNFEKTMQLSGMGAMLVIVRSLRANDGSPSTVDTQVPLILRFPSDFGGCCTAKLKSVCLRTQAAQ